MRWGAIEVEVVFLDVLAVVPLRVRQAEQALLDDRVLAIPQREGKAQDLPVVADPGKAVLAPAIGPGAGLVMGEVVPGVTAAAVVLAHRSPLALGQVRSPASPRNALVAALSKALVFGRLCHVDSPEGCLCRNSAQIWIGRSSWCGGAPIAVSEVPAREIGYASGDRGRIPTKAA